MTYPATWHFAKSPSCLLGQQNPRRLHSGIVVAGEAKNRATGLDNADIEADVALSAALGAEMHLMIASEPVAEEAIERATRHAHAAELGLIVIQGEAVERIERDD